MSDPLTLLLSLLAGGALGALFYGGLWWTVRRVVSAKHPALLVFGSFALRTSAVLAGFYLTAGPHWDRLLTCFFGFFVARPVVTRLTRPLEGTKRPPPAHEASHAP